MVRASYAQEHASYVEHARHPLHANGQLTTSVMTGAIRFASPLNVRRVPSTRANDVSYDIRASYVQEHASYIEQARHPLHTNGQLTMPLMAQVVRCTSPSNARRVTGTRAKDMPYDGSGILRSRTCVICQTCATSAARQRPAHNVRNGRLRAPKPHRTGDNSLSG